MAMSTVVKIVTDFVTVLPTPRPSTKSTFATSISASSTLPTTQEPSFRVTSSVVTSVSATSTPTIPPAPIAELTQKGSSVAPLAIAGLVLVTFLYITVIGYCIVDRCRGQCHYCGDTESQMSQWKKGKGILPITVKQVREREKWIEDQRTKEREKALAALEGRTEQLAPEKVVIPSTARQWTECATREPPRPPEPPRQSERDSPISPVPSVPGLTIPVSAHLQHERPITPFDLRGTELQPDRNTGEVFYNNRYERISHFEPYM